ncbi:MAG: hypothetical protein IPG98_15285 [Burkholderiales bacterium]|nr:hypothetical protein [Burkholderiales bacterium]MBK8667042.1 hypothetical protein [Burkholderiales bacterium]
MAKTAFSHAAANATILAQSGRTLDPIQRQAAIENALSMALHFMRRPGDSAPEHAANLWAATARTNRALTLLKLASEDARRGRA